MASLDIGIDLGTTTILAGDTRQGTVITEPSIVAVHRRTGEILNIGTAVYQMIGRTPDNIEVVRPLTDGVISDYKMTEVLIRFLLKKMCKNQLVKPRVSVCVPSEITGVESQAVVEATKAAGARHVYLIEEPVAAAIGAGIDLSKPNGNLIVDIGGGTSDIPVLSLNGIVCKTSMRIAGQKFDEALIKYMRSAYSMLIGEKTAEVIKMEIGSVNKDAEDIPTMIKGRDLISGLPKKIEVFRSELFPVFMEVAEGIIRGVQSVLERTPPELVGDIRTNGLILTGGGALLNGLDRAMEIAVKVPCHVAENAVECVALGTAKSFDYLDQLYDGFLNLKNF